MSYDDKMEADTPGNQPNTQSTITTLDSYEFTQEEAEAIQKSMDLSMEFWGYARDASGIIPANRLKAVLPRPSKASQIADAIWQKMKPDDIENVQRVEKILMLNGEVKIDQLFEALESISEGVGLTFQDLFPESDNDDIIKTATDIMNELLSVYNELVPMKSYNEEGRTPPGRVEIRSLNSIYNRRNSNEVIKIEKECEKNNEIHNKPPENVLKNEKNPSTSKKIIDQTEEQVLESLRELSDSGHSEHSKLRLLEKRMSSSIRRQILQDILFSEDVALEDNSNFQIKEPEKLSAFAVRREMNMKKRAEISQNRPKFKVPGKINIWDWKEYPILKNSPSLQRNLRRARKSLINPKEGETTDPRHKKNRNIRFGTPGATKTSNRNDKERDERNKINNYPIFTVDQAPFKEKKDSFRSNNSSTDLLTMLTTDKNRRLKSANRNTVNTNPLVVRNTPRLVHRAPSKDKVLLEVKKLLKEAMLEIGKPKNVTEKDNDFRITREAQEQTSSHILTQYSQTSDTEIGLNLDLVKGHQTGRSSHCMTVAETDMNVDIQRLMNKKEDTLDIKVTQESFNPLLWPLMRESDRTITTEISLSQYNQVPTLKVSLVNKVKSEEEGLSQLAKEQPQRVQEAVHYLTELLETNATYNNARNGSEVTNTLEEILKSHEIVPNVRENPFREDMTKSEDSSALTVVTKTSDSDMEGQQMDDSTALPVLPIGHNSSENDECSLSECQPTMNVNMALILEDITGFSVGSRDDPRACRLFQLMVGEEPPNVHEEIGDVGNGVWLTSHSSWSQQIWRNLSDNIASDSMDSLFVHADNRSIQNDEYPDIVRESCRSALLEDAYHNLAGSTISAQSITLPGSNYNYLMPHIDEADIQDGPVDSDILLTKTGTVVQEDDGRGSEVSMLARAKPSSSAGMSQAAVPLAQRRGKRSLTRTVLGVFGLLLTGAFIVLKRPIVLPVNFLKHIWTGFLGRSPPDIG